MAYSSFVSGTAQQVIGADIAVGGTLQRGDALDIGGVSLEEVRKALLRPQILLDRHLAADRRRRRNLAVLRLEEREEAALSGQAGHPDGVGGVAAPAERARHQDMDVAGAVQAHGPR